MAFTITVNNAYSDFPESGRRIVYGTITGDSSYATGGQVVSPASFGVVTHPITGATVFPAPSVIDSFVVGASTDGSRLASWNPTTSKMLIFSTAAAPIVEVANASDQSSKSFSFVALVR